MVTPTSLVWMPTAAINRIRLKASLGLDPAHDHATILRSMAFGPGQDRYLPVQQGRCWSCGLLAKYQTRQYLEASTEDRERGDIGQLMVFSTPVPEEVPRCFRWAADLEGDFRKAMVDGFSGREATLAIIGFDRHCETWMPYQPSMSPKDHWDWFSMIQLEEQRAARDERLAAIERDSRLASEQIQKDSAAITADLKAIMTRADHFTTKWTKRAFWLAVAGVLLVAAGYVFPDAGRHLGDFFAGLLSHSPVVSPSP
jgi:hypothetical protein